MRKMIVMSALAVTLFALMTPAAEARGRSAPRSHTRSHATRSHATRSYSHSHRPSYRAPSRGYYRGPRQSPGHFQGGGGSSHKGGHYTNSQTGDRYQKRP